MQIATNQLKKLLVEDGVIGADDFDKVLNEAERMKQSVVDVLVSRGAITSDYYYTLLSKYFGVERVSLFNQDIDPAILKMLPEDIARQRQIILFKKEANGAIDVAMQDPSDVATIDFLKSRFSVPVNFFLATPDDLINGFALYGKQSATDFRKEIEDNVRVSLRSKVLGKEAKEAAVELPIISITDTVISYAFSLNASDIHLEILDDYLLIRYRIDGILREITRIPKEVHMPIAARIKLLSGLRLDEHAKPQDGRFRHKIGDSFVDIRVSVIPTYYGEKVEMRLLSSAARPLSLKELGMMDDMIDLIHKNIMKAYGLFIVCGPTGSGKTTTLYSILNILNTTDVNIVTIEDPIEYNMKYVNQTQVNVTAGITFANGLRSILRQDPNIIMVGEIRDEETAEIAVDSALTGHRVISSLHTNDAATSVPRLIDMKVPAFLVAAVLSAVLAQRLVRRLCLGCAVSYEADAAIIEAIRQEFKILGIESKFNAPKTLFKGLGCAACDGSGYKGRIGIFEILNVDEEIRRVIVGADFTLDRLIALMQKKGTISMFEDGLRKARVGMTTIDEIFRVIRE